MVANRNRGRVVDRYVLIDRQHLHDPILIDGLDRQLDLAEGPQLLDTFLAALLGRTPLQFVVERQPHDARQVTLHRRAVGGNHEPVQESGPRRR